MTDGKLTLRQTRSIIAAHPAGTFGARCAWPSRPSDNLIHALTITEPITSPPDVPRMTLTFKVLKGKPDPPGRRGLPGIPDHKGSKGRRVIPATPLSAQLPAS